MTLARGHATRIAKRGFTDADLLALVDQGMKSTAIQVQLGCTAQIVRNICRKHGRPSPGRGYWYNEEIEQTMIKMRSSGVGNAGIAQALGITRSTVVGKLSRLKVQGELSFEPIKSVAPEMTPELRQKLSEIHRAKRGYTDQDVIELTRSGATPQEIRNRLGCSQQLIQRVCDRNGIERPKRTYESAWSDEQTNELRTMVHQGMPRSDIAKKIGVTIGALIAKMHRHGITYQKSKSPSITYKHTPITYSFPDADAIAAFIAARGVTLCPAAAVAVTTASLPAHDRAVLAKHQDDRFADYMAKIGPRQKRATEAAMRSGNRRGL